jgi:cobalt-zinc-cadmium efflux system protein
MWWHYVYMDNNTPHTHTRQRSEGVLRTALAITAGWFVLELVAGFYTNSLALLADAAHMLTDLAALGLSLFAVKIAGRPATVQKTYGYLRAEILAALANGVFLVLVSIFICYQAYGRFTQPPEVRSLPMLVVAGSGLLANLATAALLYRTQHESLNLRGAFLHVVGDTLGSVGAIAAGIVMLAWHWYLADPIASVLVSVLVLVSAWQLVRESADVLLEAAPSGISIPSILADLGSVGGVRSIHDLHVWSITSGMPAMSCHVVLKQGLETSAVLEELSRLMREKYGIEHTTIQIEEQNAVIPGIEIK